MKTSLRMIALAAVASATGQAFGALTITVVPSVGPNFFDSPTSWAGYANNAMSALVAGSPSAGPDRNVDPTGYEQANDISAYNIIHTTFPSWDGQANPGGAFANEYGNALHFGLRVISDGDPFSLDSVSVGINSGDPAFFVAEQLLTGDYSQNRRGYNSDTDTWVTSGSGDQLVHEFYYIGIFTYFVEDDPANLTNGNYDLDAPFSVSGYYSVYAGGDGPGDTPLATGTGTADVVPEPSVPLLSLLAFGGLAARRRR